jgi:uncharacterized secreted repeat protein (TIGR03808 family)
MTIDRRSLIANAAILGAALPGAALATRAVAQTPQPQGLDAAHFGVRAGSPDDQTKALQNAIDQAAQKRAPLWLAAGVYRAAGLNLPAGAQIAGVRGMTRLVLSKSAPLLTADKAENTSLNGLVFDGGKIALPEKTALLQLRSGHDLHVNDCEIISAGGDAIMCRSTEGQITNCTITDAADTAIFSLDGINMLIAGNTIRNSGNGGIRVWQSEKHADGAIVVDNQIEDTAARSGGSGQNGNAINVYRAHNVIVRGNRIRGAAFSAVRGNAASQIQIVGNNCTGIGEVALYCEFDFEGAAISGNTVDGAALGIAVTNFKEGGRLATVQGNVLRNITFRRPAGTDPNDGFGIGIGVEADTAVTGNVIENAATVGIAVGNGPYMRDVTVTGNVVRGAPTGIMVSVAKGAGAAVVSHNLINGARRGAIVGMEWQKVVTADLAVVAPGAYPHLTISGNQVR